MKTDAEDRLLTNMNVDHTMLAQVIQMALHEQHGAQTNAFPEKKYVDGMKLDGAAIKKERAIALVAATVVVTTTYLLVRFLSKSKLEKEIG